MLEYLEKFNNLPDDVKQNVSTGAVMAAIEELEGKYGVDLANFVIRVMVGDLYYKNITANLIIEFNLAPGTATQLAKELQDKVFDSVKEYLSTGKSSTKVGTQDVVPMQAVPIRSAATPAAAPQENKKLVNFLEEDKKDIAEMSKIIPDLKAKPQEKFSRLLEETVKESNIGFASEVLQKRFNDILLTYLRGIRTKVEVREKLMKDIASGGIKMTPADADRILLIAQKKLSADQEKFSLGSAKVSAQSSVAGTNFVFNQDEIKKALEQRSGKPASNEAATGKKTDSGAIPSRDVAYDLSALKNSAAAKIPEIKALGSAGTQNIAPKQNSDTPKAPIKITPVVVPKPSLAKTSTFVPQSGTTADKSTENMAPPKSLSTENIASLRNDVPAAGNKQKMEDIKPAPRIMSPIDELGYMDLLNFRRLDPNPLKRIAKIEEKIALLEREGIDKKIEGIRVWRNNPVSKTYLAMGQESIGSGKNIDDIIKERQDQGLNYLSKEEFEAVMDLNNNLRF